MNSSIRSIRKACRRAQLAFTRLLKDHRGIAATEFAVIAPVMLLMFFGTVEITSAIAIKRKVTTMARTISDLTSQAGVVNNTDLANFFAADSGIMVPYSATPISMRVSELHINSAGNGIVEWSYAVGTALPALAPSNPSPITVPPGLVSRDSTNAVLPNQYLILGEVSYAYTATVQYVLKSTVTLQDASFTRPRQSTCVFYPSTPTPATCPTL